MCYLSPFLYLLKKLILNFEEFNNKFNIDNHAMSDIRIKDIGRDISLTPIEIEMRDQSPKTIR